MNTLLSYAALFAGLVFVYVSLPEPRDKGPLETEASETQMVVRGAQSRFEYSLGARREISITMTLASPPHGARESGVLQAVSYFTPKARDAFVEKYGPGKPCPAPFYRRHAQHKMLFADTPQIAERLRALPQGSMRDTGKWHQVTLTGRCITDLDYAEIRDQQVALPREMTRRCMSFVVEDFELSAPGAI
ncbi:hypothetical protein [Primorskyibacter sp. S187A]|uniref:hypothetical protein n=1 Tax=Primorskyibacter sp. S187A TaxID=3415130 RepID=UPI003C7D268D